MQVVHDNSGVTHAVLGKGETIDFRASTSAQVLFLLSTGLYKYPRLAAVREIICNGWDSHIKSGIRHKPLSISISSEGVLSVRDYGEGIAHEDIGPIYCTAGDSTKVQSEEETGGFGLGSKAPFAYRDHFTVISSHGGKRTMYAMAMSDSQSMGKPTAKVLHSGDTDSTGIEVQLQLKPDDVDQFEKIIRRVVYLGDINATFNGEQLSVCGMDEAGSDVSVIRKDYNGDMYSHLQVGVRYGAVVYPLEVGDEYADEYNKLIRIIDRQFGGFNGSMLVLRAPGGSISMVPSREALLYNPRTTRTVIALIKKAVESLKKASTLDAREHLATIITRAAICGWDPIRMLDHGNHHAWPDVTVGIGTDALSHYTSGLRSVMPVIDPAATEALQFDIFDLFKHGSNAHSEQEYAMWFIAHNFRAVMEVPKNRQFWRKRTYDVAMKIGNFNKAIAAKVMKLAVGAKSWQEDARKLIQEYISKPYMTALMGLVDDAHTRLYALDTHSSGREASPWVALKDNEYINKPWEKSVFNALPRYRGALLDIAQPLFVLVWEEKACHEWVNRINRYVTQQRHSFMYFIKLKRGTHDAVAVHKALLKNGWAVINQTDAQGIVLDREKEERRQLAAERRAQYLLQKERGIARAKRATKESMASLANTNTGTGIELDRWQDVKEPVMLENPKAIMIRKMDRKRPHRYEYLDEDMTAWLVTKYQNVTGITNNEKTAERFYANGSIPFDKMLCADLMHNLDTNPKLLQYMAEVSGMEDERLHNDYYMKCLYGDLLIVGKFREHLGLTALNHDEMMWVNLFKKILDSKYYFPGHFDRTKYKKPAPVKCPEALKKLRESVGKHPKLLHGLSRQYMQDLTPDAQADLVEFIIKFNNL